LKVPGNIIRMIKSSSWRCPGDIALMTAMRNAYKIFVGGPRLKRE